MLCRSCERAGAPIRMCGHGSRIALTENAALLTISLVITIIFATGSVLVWFILPLFAAYRGNALNLKYKNAKKRVMEQAAALVEQPDLPEEVE